jgi:2'-5' RNA ligase
MNYQSFLKEHYDQMWIDSKPSILKNDLFLDLHLNNLKSDKRRGLTLVTHLNPDSFGKVSKIMKGLEEIEPEQYYYPLQNIHLTIINITDLSEDFVFDQKQCEIYKKILKKIFYNAQPIKVELKGVTTSKGAVIIQGFCNNSIKKLRKKIREEFCKEGVGLKEDYLRETAHVTIIRFRKKLHSPLDFVNQIEKSRNISIGMMRIEKARLVLHDWYNRKEKTKIIEEYYLG